MTENKQDREDQARKAADEVRRREEERVHGDDPDVRPSQNENQRRLKNP